MNQNKLMSFIEDIRTVTWRHFDLYQFPKGEIFLLVLINIQVFRSESICEDKTVINT